MTAKKGKEGVKDDKVLRDSAPDSNHANEQHKGTGFVHHDLQLIKEELSKLSGKDLYLRARELIEQENLTREDWHEIDYQKKVYQKLMKENFDILKIKTLNAKWRASVGPKNDQEAEEDNHALNSKNWFSDDEKNSHFVSYKCAKDYLRVFPHVVTEYMGTMHQFTGKYYHKNAEGMIRTNIENAGSGIVKPRDISDAVESLTNITRIIDPDKINLPMERIMPLPAHTIPIEDGLLNLLTKTITPHSPEYYYTECLPRNYIPGAKPDVFLSFLDSLFQGDPDAHLKKTQIFEVIAWTLMNNYDIQGAVILYGQGGEGKSIIHSVIADLLVHVTSLTLAELESDKFKRAELYGSWANLISESSSEIITSEWFKRLSDGTTITVDRKNGHPFQMASRAKLILDVNELPNKDNELRAFYRRVIAIIDFPNLLEAVLTPTRIGEFVREMKDPAELDRIFSYVVDNYYGPLVSRMKFTGQLSLAEAEQKWEERSNPAKSYLKMKNEAGEILTDVDVVKEVLAGMESESRYITRESSGEEYLTMVKADVINDAVNWAVSKGFPAKTIHGGTLGSALTSMGFHNQSVNKKISKGTVLKAWKDIYINIDRDQVAVEVADRRNPSLPPENGSEIGKMQSGSGSPLSSVHARAHARMRETIEGSATGTCLTLENTEKNNGSGHFDDPLPEPLPPGPEITKNFTESASGDKKYSMRDAKEMTDDPWSHPTEPIPDPSAITIQDAQTALRVIVADGFHAIPAESRLSMDGKSFMISVSKPQSEDRARILKDRLAALGFMLRNTGALGPLIFSVAIQEEQP